jgi:hypothetical protein
MGFRDLIPAMFVGVLVVGLSGCDLFLPEDWGRRDWPCREDSDCRDDFTCSFGRCIEYVPCGQDGDCEGMGIHAFCEFSECHVPIDCGNDQECKNRGFDFCMNFGGARQFCTVECWNPYDCGMDPGLERCFLSTGRHRVAVCAWLRWVPPDGIVCDPNNIEMGCPDPYRCVHFATDDRHACAEECEVDCPQPLVCMEPNPGAPAKVCASPFWFGLFKECPCPNFGEYQDCADGFCTKACAKDADDCPSIAHCDNDKHCLPLP